ncbi:hypothetical protein [Streptomyces apocyni]|uniref:hypothetical protein n=1 Tax=Streptomyces apocyni TaxID=2654677 RepID=UPI0012EA9805|nr:hypothetical protein [Streptomyces apocyni]
MDEQFIPSVPHPGGPGWLGSYVSVETVSDGRGHHHTAVMDKLPLSVVDEVGRLRAHAVRETGDIFPSALPEASLTRVRELVSRTLDVLGVRWRVSHTEVKLSRRARRLSR